MPPMKAVQIHRFGAEEVMQLDEVEIPSPEARQMVIKIAATSINHSDLFIRQNGNIHIGAQDLPLILGRELAGTVVEACPNVTEFAPGQRVVALPAVQTRATGLPGSKEYTGCYAEYSLARPQDTRPLPDEIDWVTGAATPWAALTAWYVLAAAQVKAGDRVFIQAGGSGIGTFAVQFARILGAQVFATAGSDEKCARAASSVRTPQSITNTRISQARSCASPRAVVSTPLWRRSAVRRSQRASASWPRAGASSRWAASAGALASCRRRFRRGGKPPAFRSPLFSWKRRARSRSWTRFSHGSNLARSGSWSTARFRLRRWRRPTVTSPTGKISGRLCLLFEPVRPLLIHVSKYPVPSSLSISVCCAQKLRRPHRSSTIEGSSFSGLLTRVEIGHIRIRPAGKGRMNIQLEPVHPLVVRQSESFSASSVRSH